MSRRSAIYRRPLSSGRPVSSRVQRATCMAAQNGGVKEICLTPAMEPGDREAVCQRLDFYRLIFYNDLYDNMDERRAAEGGRLRCVRPAPFAGWQVLLS